MLNQTKIGITLRVLIGNPKASTNGKPLSFKGVPLELPDYIELAMSGLVGIGADRLGAHHPDSALHAAGQLVLNVHIVTTVIGSASK